MDFEAYSIDELRQMLTADEIVNAIDMERVIVDADWDGQAVAHFRHTGDIDGESSYITLSFDFDSAQNAMSPHEMAQAIANDMISLVEDDPDTYADEMSFYADIITGAAC